VANKVQILSTDGRSMRDAPNVSRPVSMLSELAGVHQRLDAVLPAVRPRERLGGLAAARAAEREKARASIEGTFTIDNMRAAGKNVRAIAEAHKVAVEAAKQDRFLSEEGRDAKVVQLRQALDARLEENANKYLAAESELLKAFHGRSKTWAATRDKSAPVASTHAAAIGLAGLLPLWTPEDVLKRLEQAIDERDVVLIDVAQRVVRNLLFTDKRYESLQASAETLLEDANTAMGDEDTDAAEIAKELADSMRAELNAASKLVLKNESWDPVLDSAGYLKAFDSLYSDGESSAA
jgi:hypothetical protein